jgi:acyl-CoA synthetase (AMP-forming)/AMP-acid ligase II
VDSVEGPDAARIRTDCVVNVGLTVTRAARRRPQSPALLHDDGRVTTYLELDERSNRITSTLRSAYGVERGDRVALLVANRPEVVELLLGVAKSGGVYVGLNFRLDQKDLRSIFENAEPRLLLTDSSVDAAGQAIAHELGVPVVNIDDPGWQHGIDAASPAPPPSLHDIAHTEDFCIVYSSGTTGVPKGILFDHAAAIQHATVACLEYGITQDSRYLLQIPHNSSVNITFVPCLMAGASLAFADSRGFDAERFVDAVERFGITHSFLVPTMLFRILDQVPDGARLKTVETLGYGSAPIPPQRLRELVDRFGNIFNQLYGMAEVASIGTILRKEDHGKGLQDRPELLASCGQPSYALDVRVVDDEGCDVAVGVQGEIVFSGPHIMKGYYRDPVRTAETLRDGWVHSGDLARVDEDGYIYVVDRKKDLIIRGGLNIAPREVEETLLSHPSVLEAAVIGVPDEEWGESLLAVIALREHRSAEPEELREWCRAAGLSSIKVPGRVEFVRALPRNAVGKVAKAELRRARWTGSRAV